LQVSSYIAKSKNFLFILFKPISVKKIILPFCFLLLCTGLQAQQTPQKPFQSMTDPELGLYYLQKNKRQKTTGWILLGGGLALYTAGIVSFSNNIWSESTGGAEVLALAGSLSMIACIPVFITAAKNKGRAEILLRNQNIPLGRLPAKQLSLGIAVALGR
jgi:hypothetical protein